MKLFHDLPSNLRSALQAEQFRILRTQIPVLYAVLSINTAVLCYSVYGKVPIFLSTYAPGLFALLIVVRLAIWVTRRFRSPTDTRVARYLISTTIVAAVVSFGLGIWGVALLRWNAGGPSVPLFVAFGAIACTYCLASLPRAAFATILLATTPPIGALLISSVTIEQAAGVNLLLIFLLILRLIVHQYNYVVDNVVSHAQLRLLAYADPLTALPNRRAFIECLEGAIRSSEEANAIAVAMIDLDGFKAINDTYGHAAGDVVLIQAAERIQAGCMQCRMVARLGGDEFAVLIVGADAVAGLANIGQALVSEMSAPFVVTGSHLRLAASVGMAVHALEDASALTVMARADVALYEVKHGGGEGVSPFAPAMGQRLQRRVAIAQSLREINPPPQIEVLYQPIFDARTRRVTTFEALARWDHPAMGPINPMEFIGIAEKTGTIARLSEQIFTTAIQDAAHWDKTVGLSLNLSALDLCRPTTPLRIMSLLDRYGFDPKRLEVEVTETTVLSDFDIARSQLELLRGSGIRVALDDFGSGYASISYLKEITFDRVKIDGELIADIINCPKARRLLHGVLQLCAAIKVPTTAEKVESEDQLAVLVGLGCDRIQGYLLGRPMTAEQARELTSIQKKAA